MKILFLSNAPFCDDFILGSHQLAEQFMRMDHDVLHISTPVTPLHVLKHGGVKKIKAALRPVKISGWSVLDNIPIVVFPYGYFSILDRVNDYLVLRYLRRMGWDRCDLILVDQPAFWGVLDKISASCKVYRPTDIYKYMSVTRHADNEEKLLKKVKAVIATSDNILKELNVSLPSCVVNNGADVEKFEQFAKQEFELRKDCVYVGAVDSRFDFEVMALLAGNNPDINFHVYGPGGPCGQAFSNLIYHGAVAYEKLPELLSKYRLALMPLSDDPANDGRSPMKLYEYMASGLPVFSKKMNGLSTLSSDYIFCYESHDEALINFRTFYDCLSLDISDLAVEESRKHGWKSKAKYIIDWTHSLP